MKKYLAFAAAALLSGVAFGQGGGTSSAFDSLDANQDGRIDQQEAQSHPTVAQAFTSADANGDGALSREEFDSSFTTSQQQTPMPPDSGSESQTMPPEPDTQMPPEPQQ